MLTLKLCGRYEVIFNREPYIDYTGHEQKMITVLTLLFLIHCIQEEESIRGQANVPLFHEQLSVAFWKKTLWSEHPLTVAGK